MEEFEMQKAYAIIILKELFHVRMKVSVGEWHERVWLLGRGATTQWLRLFKEFLLSGQVSDKHGGTGTSLSRP